MGNESAEIMEGMEYEVKVDAKGTKGEGIGRIGDFVVFIKKRKDKDRKQVQDKDNQDP